jgi:RNA polymerase primary sigma factor
MLKNSETRDFAKNKLIEGNLRLVVKMAHDWKGKGLGIEDLVAEGNIALTTAADKFDVDCGKKFSTYAIWWIRTAMSRAISDSHTVRIPVASELKKRNVNRFIDNFKVKFDREPTHEEIKKGMGLSDVELRNVYKLENSCVSMNAKFDDSDEQSDEIGDIIAQEQEVESVIDEIVKNEEVQALYKAIKQLDERERIVIVMRYGIGGRAEATLDEVAVKIGKTKERVRQIQKNAEEKMHKIMLGLI